MSTPLGSFQIFSKIREDILEWMFITGVNDTGDKLLLGEPGGQLTDVDLVPVCS